MSHNKRVQNGLILDFQDMVIAELIALGHVVSSPADYANAVIEIDGTAVRVEIKAQFSTDTRPFPLRAIVGEIYNRHRKQFPPTKKGIPNIDKLVVALVEEAVAQRQRDAARHLFDERHKEMERLAREFNASCGVKYEYGMAVGARVEATRTGDFAFIVGGPITGEQALALLQYAKQLGL